MKKGRISEFSRIPAGVIGLVVPTIFLISWELLASVGVLNSIFFPPPSRLALLSSELLLDGTIWLHLSSTLQRLLPAIFMGAFSGIALGLVMASSLMVRSFLEPSLLSIYSIPKIALLPIFLAIFGAGESALTALISVAIFFYVWIYTMSAALRTPKNLSITARVFGASKFQITLMVVFRSALPETMSGLRVGVTVGLLVCLTSEFVLGSDGIGYLLLGSRSLGQYGYSYVGIFLAASLGLLLQRAVIEADKRINPWVFRSSFSTLLR